MKGSNGRLYSSEDSFSSPLTFSALSSLSVLSFVELLAEKYAIAAPAIKQIKLPITQPAPFVAKHLNPGKSE